MFIDADTVARHSHLDADICIVGGGAAGISLALALCATKLSVLLLESGYVHEHAGSQALYSGNVSNERLHSPPDRYRQRRLGGSTAIWGGRCVPFDPLDFEPRDYLDLSGWPIHYGDLAPYYPAANTLAEAGRFQYDADEVFGPKGHPLIAGFSSDLVRTNSLERFSCPTNFAARYHARLRAAPNLTMVTGANCTSIRLRPDGTQVRELTVATLSGNSFCARARSFVLAVGGLETPRLLLASRDVAAGGIGNEHDVVGRYYMCHIAGSVGTLTVQGSRDRVRHGYEVAPDGVYCRRRLALTPQEQRRQGVLNMVARLHFSRIADPAHRSGVLSTLFLARRLISWEYGQRMNDGGTPSLAMYLRHMRNLLADPLDTCAFALHWLRMHCLAERKYPSVILRNRTNRFSLEINSEQLPQAASRITLLTTTDALGVPRLCVDWRYSPVDIDSVRRTLDVFASELGRDGICKFEYDRDALEQDLTRFGAYGGHHIGTARMGSDVRTSVVDANCRVHSIDNLYIAGSAVFPTSSQANPTLTIIALALRLAEHLARRHDASEP